MPKSTVQECSRNRGIATTAHRVGLLSLSAAGARYKFLKRLRKRSSPKRNTEAWQEGRKSKSSWRQKNVGVFFPSKYYYLFSYLDTDLFHRSAD